MRKLGETTALAIVFGNTRRKKRKEDLVTIARAVEYLVKLYKSQKAVAEKVGLSPEMIRQFLTVLKLPAEVQKLFSNRQIDSVDVAKDLVALKDRNKQTTVARKMTDLLSKDARDVQRIVKGERIPVKKAKEIILQAKKGLHIFMLDLDDETYQRVVKEARALRKDPAELVREIVVNWSMNKKSARLKGRIT